MILRIKEEPLSFKIGKGIEMDGTRLDFPCRNLTSDGSAPKIFAILHSFSSRTALCFMKTAGIAIFNAVLNIDFEKGFPLRSRISSITDALSESLAISQFLF